LARAFHSIDYYRPSHDSYKLLPFRFLRLNESKELLVNEVGEFVIAPTGTARALIRKELDCKSEIYLTFKAKQFISDDNSSMLLDLLATKYRTKYSFIEGSTKLHIFVVTLRCDHSCHYCQVSRQTTDKSAYDMSFETAEKSIDLMIESPARNLTMELQGGEPLLAFDLIRRIVPVAKKRAEEAHKDLRIVVTTNLANVTDDILFYLRDEGIHVSTSLDGPASIHNINRPRPGNDSYQLAIANIERARKIVGSNRVAALMTTTQLSLSHPIEIIDEYVKQGFHSIFLRPISPYGFALKTQKRTGYPLDSFLRFYKKGLAHILEINARGYSLAEVYAKILLTKIMTPFGTGFVDLQSPAGAGMAVLVYNYDGDVYATDESRMLAEMGDYTFRLGNVHDHKRRDIFTGEPFVSTLAASCNQSLAGCSDCALQTYCGSDPVFNHSTQGDVFGHRPTSDFCARNMAIIKHLFTFLDQDEPTTIRTFLSWVNNSSLSEVARLGPA
jgi:His-Xaa-Ser system radical SAM maturase HxsB